MLRILLIVMIFLKGLLAPSLVLAAEINSTDSSVNELSVLTVAVEDSSTLQVAFSEPVDVSSIVLKVAKQSDGTSLTIGNITPAEDMPEEIKVVLNTELEEGSSYTLTVLAAIAV